MPRSSTTPLLDRLGRDLTALARQGLLAPVVGREEETPWVIETLLRDTKRNPVLLGPPGVGKTAIVEGLAQRIAAGKVPDRLKDTRSSRCRWRRLVAGTQYRGQLEERIQQLVKEASQPGIVLFLDEIHMLESAGSRGRPRRGGGIEAGAGARRHRGDRGDNRRRVPDDDRARRLTRAATVDAWRSRSSTAAATMPILKACATASPRRAA